MKRGWLPPAGQLLMLGLAACGGGSMPTAPLPRPTPSPTPPSGSSPSPLPINQPPRLEVRVTPTPISGTAPLTIKVNLCRSSDPEGDALSYVFEYQREGKRFTLSCSERHVYAAPVTSQAVFCVSDGLPRHLVCQPFQVRVR